jgi:hypothetical protein
MTSTPIQIITIAVWVLIFAGAAFAEPRELQVACVLLAWGILITHIWRGPMKPPLLMVPRRWRMRHGDTVVVKLPADYVRLGESVPDSAITLWWALNVLAVISFVGFTIVLLTQPGGLGGE